MSTASASDKPTTGWWTHHAVKIGIVGSYIGALSHLLFGYTSLFTWSYLTACLVMCLLAVRHKRTLCDRCVQEWPLNGSEVAEQRARSLAFFHYSSSRGYLLCLFTVLIASTALERLVPPLQRPIDAVTFVYFGTFLWLISRHNGMEPWCPRCRDEGGGGIEEVVPDPDPVRENTPTG